MTSHTCLWTNQEEHMVSCVLLQRTKSCVSPEKSTGGECSGGGSLSGSVPTFAGGSMSGSAGGSVPTSAGGSVPGSAGVCSRRREPRRPPHWGWCRNTGSTRCGTSPCSSPLHNTETTNRKLSAQQPPHFLSPDRSSSPSSGQSQWRSPSPGPPCSEQWPSSSGSLFSPSPEDKDASADSCRNRKWWACDANYH